MSTGAEAWSSSRPAKASRDGSAASSLAPRASRPRCLATGCVACSGHQLPASVPAVRRTLGSAPTTGPRHDPPGRVRSRAAGRTDSVASRRGDRRHVLALGRTPECEISSAAPGVSVTSASAGGSSTRPGAHRAYVGRCGAGCAGRAPSARAVSRRRGERPRPRRSSTDRASNPKCRCSRSKSAVRRTSHRWSSAGGGHHGSCGSRGRSTSGWTGGTRGGAK
jgi:hypothetical protein